MSKNSVHALVVLSFILLIVSCKSEQPAPVEPVAPPPAPIPVAEPEEDTDTATEPELPPTEEPAEQPAATSGGGISKSSLIGNYSCSVTSDQFPMGITPPAAMCKIYEGSGENLKIGPVGNTGINGTISNISGGSFSVVGSFNVGIGELKINARLSRRSSSTYKGKGTGELGGTGATLSYTLTLKKK